MMNRAFLLGYLLVTVAANAQQQKTTADIKTTQNQSDEKTDYKLVGAPMPRMKVLLYEDTAKKVATTSTAEPETRKARKHKKEKVTTIAGQTYLTAKDVDNGANLFIMLFNPTCGHCQDMTKHIENNIDLFKKSHLVFIATPMMSQYLHDFSELTKVYDYPSIKVGIDSSRFVDNAFLYQMLPQINIYDGDRKLLKIYTGDTPFDSLKKYIQ
jgi:protein-disulfide isomerase